MRNGTVTTTTAGLLNIRIDGTHYSAYCFDLFTSIAINDTFPVNGAHPTANTVQARAAWAIANYLGSTTQAFQSAALQLAVWDILHDNGDGLAAGAGRIQVSTVSGRVTPSNIATLAGQIIQASVGKSYTGGNIYTHISGPSVKQMLYVSDVPEPATIFLSGTALAALIAWRKRGPKK